MEEEILQDLISETQADIDETKSRLDKLFSELVKLCILNSSQEGQNIMSQEEKYIWDLRNEKIKEFESALQEHMFLRHRLNILHEKGIAPFRENYGLIRNQESFVKGLKKP